MPSDTVVTARARCYEYQTYLISKIGSQGRALPSSAHSSGKRCHHPLPPNLHRNRNNHRLTDSEGAETQIQSNEYHSRLCVERFALSPCLRELN